jgi:hypothetical protein
MAVCASRQAYISAVQPSCRRSSNNIGSYMNLRVAQSTPNVQLYLTNRPCGEFNVLICTVHHKQRTLTGD